MVIWPLAAQHQFDACCGNFGTSMVDTSGGLQQADKVRNAKSPQIKCALFITATLQRVQSFNSGIIQRGRRMESTLLLKVYAERWRTQPYPRDLLRPLIDE
jgi:hypothetical protein